MSAVKSIKVTEDTYRKLARLGTLEDSFDSVISRLLVANAGRSGEGPENE
jgi:predicted CopG family antitoxin